MSVSEQLDRAIGEMVYDNIREALGPLERKAEDAARVTKQLSEDLKRHVNALAARIDASETHRVQERAQVSALVAQVQWATNKLGELEKRPGAAGGPALLTDAEFRMVKAIATSCEALERQSRDDLRSILQLQADVSELRKLAMFAHAHAGAPVGKITIR